MAIQRINSGLPTTTKIEELNSMIMELKGLIAQANFNKVEIDALYTELGSSYKRMFLRDVALGSTPETFANWTHVYAESGYSIWKIPVANYAHNIANEVYCDNNVLTFRGEATAETIVAFDKVLCYDGLDYIDNTTAAETPGGTPFDLLTSTSDYVYVGASTSFKGIKFDFGALSAEQALKVEYYNASSGSGWASLTANDNQLSDNTANFESNGSITWTTPEDWEQVAVDGNTLYWIRISTTITPVVTATALMIIPSSSVIGLLTLSSAEVTWDEWSWCTYNNHIYVTIRNIGNSSSDGDYYITSASTETNKKNYFVYNHQFSANYQDANY